MRFRTTLLVVASLVGACAGSDEPTPAEIRLITHDSFAEFVTDDTFAGFTQKTGVEVKVIAAGDAGALVNQAVLTVDNPLADVLFGVDDTFLSRALEAGIFSEHESSELNTVDPSLILDDRNLVTPIDFGDVCINYEKAWFESTSLVIPSRLDDFRASTYSAALTVEHPATSSPGLAFLLATIAEFGEPGWLDFWADLKAGGVNIAPDWNTAYYTDFRRYGGPSPMVVSYASSPPAEVIFAEAPLSESPTGVITAGCYRQIEFAGVLAGTNHPDLAGALVDFMLSREFQEQIPLTWFVFPANQEAELPPEFTAHTVLPEDPARIAPEVIAENRDRWIAEWVELMGS